MSIRIAALGLLAASAALAGEESVKLDDLPAPVLATVRSRFAGAEVIRAAREEEKGKLVYELSIKERDHNADVTLTPDGRIVLVEREIVAEDLPEAVAGALRKKYAAGVYRIVEEIYDIEGDREILSFYEVLVVLDEKRAVEVKVKPDGTIVHEEKKDLGEDDED